MDPVSLKGTGQHPPPRPPPHLLLLFLRQHNVQTTGEFSRLLQTTRCHLESELNRREAETLRLAAQIQVGQMCPPVLLSYCPTR